MVTNKKTALQFDVPVIKEGIKVKGIVLKIIENGILVDCLDGVFTGVILSKEVKELERSKFILLPGTGVEVEIINPQMRHEDGYYIISITKLLQEATWSTLLAQSNTATVITVVPTEANLGGLLVDMHGIKGFIPLSQLAPIHYPRVEDGDQEAIFAKLLLLIGQELKVRVINVDEEEKRIILSEREALKEERDKVMAELAIGKIFDGVVSGLSSYGLFVTIGGTVEGLVHISELTYGHVNDVSRLGRVGDKMKVKVIGLENGKISLSAKQIKEDPWASIPRRLKQGDIIDGEVIRFVPYGVFVRVFDDINGLIHLSELSQRSIQNPNEIVKLGQVVRAKVILLDTRKRKIGLSVKALLQADGGDAKASDKPTKKVEKPVTTTVVVPPIAKPKAVVDEIKRRESIKPKATTIEKKEATEKVTKKVVEKTTDKEEKKPAKKAAAKKKTTK